MASEGKQRELAEDLTGGIQGSLCLSLFPTEEGVMSCS